MVNDEVLEAQRIAKKEGKIRFAGVSFHGGHAEMIPAMLKLNHFDVFLISYNFTMDPSTDALIEKVRKAGLGVIAMKALAGGVKPTVGVYKIPGEMLNRLNREGAALAAVKWVLKNRNIDTVIPSITDMDQLDHEHEGDVLALHGGGRQAAGSAARAHPAVLLPHVRQLRWTVPAGAAGSRHAALSRCTPRTTASSRWGARTSSCCPRKSPRFVARHAPLAPFSVRTAWRSRGA